MAGETKKDKWLYFSAIGQDSHFFSDDPARVLILGGVELPGQGLAGNSDADVLLHALTNAISGLTTKNILGGLADRLCLEQGIADSRVYLQEALKDLKKSRIELIHLSFAVEAAKPKLKPHLEQIREALAALTGLSYTDIGITATSGEGLTAFGRAEGIQVFCIASARRAY